MAGKGGDWLDGGGNGAAVDTHELLEDPVTVKAVAEMVNAGALVSLGTTSDGGALAATVTVDGRWRRDYFRNVDELHAWLAEATPAVVDAASDSRANGRAGSPSAVNGSRSRRR